MVKDHSDSDKGFFYMHHPTYRIAHTTAFVTPVVPNEVNAWSVIHTHTHTHTHTHV